MWICFNMTQLKTRKFSSIIFFSFFEIGMWHFLILQECSQFVKVFWQSLYQTTDQSLGTPVDLIKGGGIGRRWPFLSLHSCNLQRVHSIYTLCELNRPFVSRNLRNTVSTVLHSSELSINFCLCWKVSFIFMKICLLSVLCFSRDIALRHCSPSSCCSWDTVFWGVRALPRNVEMC